MNKLEVRQAIMSGTPLVDVPDDEYLLVRGWLQDIAGESIDNGQDIYAVIALNEVKKLDEQTGSAQIDLFSTDSNPAKGDVTSPAPSG